MRFFCLLTDNTEQQFKQSDSLRFYAVCKSTLQRFCPAALNCDTVIARDWALIFNNPKNWNPSEGGRFPFIPSGMPLNFICGPRVATQKASFNRFIFGAANSARLRELIGNCETPFRDVIKRNTSSYLLSSRSLTCFDGIGTSLPKA